METFTKLELNELTMRANLNPDVIIKTRDRYLYHLKCQQVIINPRDPQHPIIRQRMMILDFDNFDRYFGKKVSEAQKIENAKTMAVEGIEIVHDPSREQTVRVEIPESAELKFRKGKMPATIADIEKLK
jgi:hypothetical protein